MEESGLVAALVLAQAEMEGAKKDKSNPHFKSKYATLESVVDAVKPALQKYGLAFIQKFHDAEGGVAVETIILHKSGEQLSNGVLSVPASKQDAQGYGSAITYARRYSLQSAFGIAPEDDDGNAASVSTSSAKQASTKLPYTPPTESSSTGLVEPPKRNCEWYINSVNHECKSEPELVAWYKDHEAEITKLVKTDKAKVLAECTRLKAEFLKPAKWTCPRGGEVTAVECAECQAVADCEVAKANIKEN